MLEDSATIHTYIHIFTYITSYTYVHIRTCIYHHTYTLAESFSTLRCPCPCLHLRTYGSSAHVLSHSHSWHTSRQEKVLSYILCIPLCHGSLHGPLFPIFCHLTLHCQHTLHPFSLMFEALWYILRACTIGVHNACTFQCICTLSLICTSQLFLDPTPISAFILHTVYYTVSYAHPTVNFPLSIVFNSLLHAFHFLSSASIQSIYIL